MHTVIPTIFLSSGELQKLGDPNDIRCVFWYDNQVAKLLVLART